MGGLPLMPVTTKSLDNAVQKGLDQVTKGLFAEALQTFQEAVRSVCMLAVTEQKDLK
jgi:hypothetical protein